MAPLTALLLATTAAVLCSAQPHWVSSWTGAPQLTEVANNPPSVLSNSVVRTVVHASGGGKQIRVQFSNLFGTAPLTISAAHVAVCDAATLDSSIVAASDTPLAFAGAAAITIPTGGAAWSDAVNFVLVPLSNLSVTVAFGSASTSVTGHPGSRTTSYQQAGSTDVSAPAMASAAMGDHWWIVTGVDAMADDPSARCVAVLGDSITDGRGSTTNRNDRWSDNLARRLRANPATVNASLVNQGIGGNAVTRGGLGPTGFSRFPRDILGQSGVHWIIIFEGVNDIGGGVAAAPIIADFDAMIAQAHAANLLIFGATISERGRVFPSESNHT